MHTYIFYANDFHGQPKPLNFESCIKCAECGKILDVLLVCIRYIALVGN